MVCEPQGSGAKKRGPGRLGQWGEEPFPANSASEKGERAAVREKGTGCFSWKEEKSSDRGKILIPQKIKQCGFQLGLVRGLFPLVQETSHKSLRSPRAFQSGDAKQNCTVCERLASPKERWGSGRGWVAIYTAPLPCHCHTPRCSASLHLPLWLTKCQQRARRDEEQMGAGRGRCVTKMDQREDDLAAHCVVYGRERTTELADGGTIALVCTSGHRHPSGLGHPSEHGHPDGHPRRHPGDHGHPKRCGHSNRHGHLGEHVQLLAGAGISALSELQHPQCSRTQGYEVLANRVHIKDTFFCKNAAENTAKQRRSWANSRANPPDDYSDFLISTETSVLMKCTEVKQPWKCQCKGERPPNRH